MQLSVSLVSVANIFIYVLPNSRQRYVLGDGAMQQMAQSSVFLSGMGALGVEIGEQEKRTHVCTTTLYL